MPMYENWFITLYTILYTAVPIQCLAVLEQDVSAEGSLRCPGLYQDGPRHRLLNSGQLAVTFLYSLYTSMVLFFLPLGIFYQSALDFQTFAVTVATTAVLTVTAEFALQTRYWTKYSAAAILFSLVVYFLSTLALHSPRLHAIAPSDYYFPGVSPNAFSNLLVWLTVLLTTWTAVLPSVTAQALAIILNPQDTHRVHSADHGAPSRRPLELGSRFTRGDGSRRSSYALSQGRGFGRLITSGAGLPSTASPQGSQAEVDAPAEAQSAVADTSQTGGAGNGTQSSDFRSF